MRREWILVECDENPGREILSTSEQISGSYTAALTPEMQHGK